MDELQVGEGYATLGPVAKSALAGLNIAPAERGRTSLSKASAAFLLSGVQSLSFRRYHMYRSYAEFPADWEES